MLIEIIFEAWIALKRNVTRSFLTMLGIVWGIATVTLLIAYGNSFRSVLVHGFDAFGKGAVICWPQQTSEQPGGQLPAWLLAGLLRPADDCTLAEGVKAVHQNAAKAVPVGNQQSHCRDSPDDPQHRKETASDVALQRNPGFENDFNQHFLEHLNHRGHEVPRRLPNG